MLQNAGAIVFSPRERDWQRNEFIVDNDTPETGYTEHNGAHQWSKSNTNGFAWHSGSYEDFENPFTAGTCRQSATTDNVKRQSEIIWKPAITESGNYAVYVSLSHHR